MKSSLVISIGLLAASAYADSPVYQLPLIEISRQPSLQLSQSPTLGNQVILSSQQIAASGANNLSQILSSVAGVEISSGLSAAPQILIHSEPALIMVNGVPLTNFSMSNPDINLIALSNVDKIIITAGSTGSIYGNQSLGGVINIITKTAAEPLKSLTVSLTNPWARELTAVAAGPINASWNYRGSYQNQYDTGYRDHSAELNNQAALNLTQQYHSGSVKLDAFGLHQNLQYAGYLTDQQVAQNSTQSFADQGQGSYVGDTGMLSIEWLQDLSDPWQVDSHLSYRAQSANSELDGSFNQRYQTAIFNQNYTGKMNLIGRQATSNVGWSVSDETYDFNGLNEFGDIEGANQQQYSLYGGLTYPLSTKLNFVASGRLLAVNTAGQFFNPNTDSFNPPSSQSQNLQLLTVGLQDQLTAETSVYLRRAMGYQLPFIDESSYTVNVDSGFGLQATTSTSYELGTHWQGDNTQLNAEAFITDLNNEIGFYMPENGIAANYNLPSTRREGISIDGQYQPNRKWTLQISATGMNNYFQQGPDIGNEIPGAAEWLASSSATYQWTKVWSVYGQWQYTGAEYAQGDNANASSKIPAYSVFNVAVNAHWQDWQLSLRLDNFSNTAYNLATVYNQYISTPHNNDVAYYPAPGRTAMLTAQYQFD
jgi:iron complex outermembrane receptor protein